MSLRHAVELAGVEMLVRSARCLPFEPARSLAASLAGRMFDRGGRRADFALKNLRVAYPELDEEQRRRIARESYVHAAWNLLDWARATAWDDDDILARVEFRGLEHVHEALSKGRGALGLALHLGAFELAVKAVPLAGVPLSAVGRPMANQRLYERVIAERSRTGAEPIDRRRAAPQMLRALRANRVVAVLNDQYSRRTRGVFVPFFGARCSTSAGVATLALRADAPVITIHTWRDAPDHHQVVFGPAVETPRSGDRSADIEAATARYNEVLEQIIRTHPEQWVWAHRRFRHSPDLPDLHY